MPVGENFLEDADALHLSLQRGRRWLVERRFPRRIRVFWSRPEVHEFLWFCVPAVAVGFALRAAMMVCLPFGYYHPDTHDFLTTAAALASRFHFTVHSKTTFLTPVLYLLAFFPKVPALVVIPFFQHLRGLLMLLLIGALVRLWMRQWRWFIVPVTTLAAMQPAVIFWEHTLMSESGFVFCAVTLALAGTWFAVSPRRLTYAALLAAMACVAAARPEGNLWQGSGILLVLVVHWGAWRLEWRRILGAFVVAFLMLSITKTSHSGLLLYSSLVQFTPDDPKVAPGFGPYIQATRDLYRTRRAEAVANDVVKASRPIQAALAAYVTDYPRAKLGLTFTKKRKSQAADGDDAKTGIDLASGTNLSNLCRRLAIEAARQQPWALPGYAWRKFKATGRDDPGGRIEEYTFHDKQLFSILGKPPITQALGRALTGSPLDTAEQARAFVYGHYDLESVRWFNSLESIWQAASNRFHLPDQSYSPTYVLPGLTWLQLLGMLGAGAALIRPGPARKFHWAFVPMVTGVEFIVSLTAAVIPRHRFVLEPFWLLYGFLCLETIVSAVVWVWRRSWGTAGPGEVIVA